MHLAHYLGLLHRAQINLADAFRQVGGAHADDVDVFHISHRLASQCDQHAEQLKPFAERYSEEAPDEPDRLHSVLFRAAAPAVWAYYAICMICTSWLPSVTSRGLL